MDPSAIGPALLVKSISIFMIGPIILLATYFLRRSSNDSQSKSSTKIVIPVFGVVFIINSVMLDANAPIIKAMGFDWLSIKGILSGASVSVFVGHDLCGCGL